MKLLTYTLKKEQNLRVGAIKNENIVDLSIASLPTDMIEFINLGNVGIEKATDCLESNVTGISPEDITIKAPIRTPKKILAVGLNYKKHVEEAKDLKDHHSNIRVFDDILPVVKSL